MAAIQMTAAQLEQPVTRILGAAGGAAQPQGSAHAVGPMGACVLGIDKMKRPKVFMDWVKEAQAKIDYMGISDNKQKVALLRSWAGRELLNFWEKEARIQFTTIPAVEATDGVAAVAEIPADTFEEIITKTKKELLIHVSRDRSLTDLLSMKQGDETWMQFISELEDAADLCRLETQPLTREDAIRVAALAGMKDRLLAEKAMTEEFPLAKLVSVGSTRESSRSNVEAMEGHSTSSIRRVPEEHRGERENRQLAPRIFMETGGTTEEDLDTAISNLTVMKRKKAGKYSMRSKGEGDRKGSCSSCTSSHETGRCPARGRKCFDCGKKNHFAKSKACTKTSSTKGKTTKKADIKGKRVRVTDFSGCKFVGNVEYVDYQRGKLGVSGTVENSQGAVKSLQIFFRSDITKIVVLDDSPVVFAQIPAADRVKATEAKSDSPSYVLMPSGSEYRGGKYST